MKKRSAAALALGLTAAATLGMALPANAAQANCQQTDEVCSVTISVTKTLGVQFSTHFTSVSGTRSYSVSSTSKTFCKGSIGYNNSGQCTLSTTTPFTGKLTFSFTKSNSKAGSVTLSAL